MLFAGSSGTIAFFNTLLHGLDVSSIIRTEIPLSEFFIGIVASFILGWLTGAIVAWVYNFSLRSNHNG